jgi:thiol-disulfide isomerase/thioredoxin
MTPEPAKQVSGRPARPMILVAGAALISAAFAAVALYYAGREFVIGPTGRPGTVPAVVQQNATSSSSGDFAFSFLDQPRPVPGLAFVDTAGAPRTLADFKGRVVLLNIWATWCVPCRAEMPTLDRLQAKLGGPDFEVVALSIDRKGLDVVKPFYAELGLTSLAAYVDRSGDSAHALGAVGVPTTLLIDREGREIGRKLGPAEWDQPEAVAVIRHAIEEKAAAEKSAQ